MSDKQNTLLLKANLLAVLLSFEKYWQVYSLSDGTLYREEVRDEAKNIIAIFYKIYGKKVLINPDNTINGVDMFRARQFVEELDKWLKTKNIFPKEFLGKEYTNKSQFYFQVVLLELEGQLEEEIVLPYKLKLTAMGHESYFRRKQMRWLGQVPDSILDKLSDQYILKMSNTDTLVMVADVRRSQDLMTYGLSANFYREQILTFLSKVKAILHKKFAIYDRFTGDGFIAYFNKYVCDQNSKDYYEMMLNACKEIQEFSFDFFDNWAKQLRKIPCEPIGLSIGIDSGSVSFKDIDNQLFAIGDACVWATRMCNAGQRGDIILNNIPYHKIADNSTSGLYKELDATTKNGESFRAYRVIKMPSKFNALPLKDPSLNQPSAIK